MYQDYDRAANQVINHLTKRHCASSIIYMNKRCFRLFKFNRILYGFYKNNFN